MGPFRKHGFSVIEEVVSRDLCVGCGVCAGVCPNNALRMRFNRYGEYNPVYVGGGCPRSCGLCLEVCPFSAGGDNEDTMAKAIYAHEDGISHRCETGYFLSSYAGYVIDEEGRWNSASGGLATWFLAELLKGKVVDRVICVAPEGKAGLLCKFVSLDDPEDVLGSRGSFYYPVELSSIIEEIKIMGLNYGIVALPCYLKAVRMAMKRVPEMGRKVKVLAGLTCGHNVSALFAEYLCALSGGDPEKLGLARFRAKEKGRSANDFAFLYESANGKQSAGRIHRSEGMGEAWARGYFKLNACNYCDDVFAELSDVVFMDAWLERYMTDPRGHNLLLVRKKEIDAIFRKGVEKGDIFLQTVAIDDVVGSQVAVLTDKREKLARRLASGKAVKRHQIEKRVEPVDAKWLEMMQLRLEGIITSRSKKVFLKGKGRGGIDYFKRKMSPLIFLLKAINYLLLKIEKGK